MDVSDALGEVAGEDAEPGTDLEHDVVSGSSIGEPPDDTQDVLVDEEVLAERLLRAATLTAGRNAARAFLDPGRERVRCLAPGLGERRERMHDVGRLVRPPAHGLWREIGAIGLGQDSVGRHRGGGLAQARSPSGT